MRSRIVLAAAAGQLDSAIARDLEVNRNTVTLWRTRFQQEGHYTSLPQRSSPGARFGTLAGSLLTGALRM